MSFHSFISNYLSNMVSLHHRNKYMGFSFRQVIREAWCALVNFQGTQKRLTTFRSLLQSLPFFLIDFIFQRCYRFTENRVVSIQIHHIPPTLTHAIASPIVNILHRRGSFVTIDELTLMHHHYSKSIVYFQVHSWSYALYGYAGKCITICIYHYNTRVFSLP